MQQRFRVLMTVTTESEDKVSEAKVRHLVRSLQPRGGHITHIEIHDCDEKVEQTSPITKERP